MTDTFEEAVRSRASGNGLVSIDLIKLMTPIEWGRIRLMSQSMEARRVATFNKAAPAWARTKTPTMDPSVIDRLLKENDHGH